MISRIERLDRAVFRVGVSAGVVCLIAVISLTFSQVVSRYLLRSPLTWSEELASYLFVWLTMLGGAAALHLGAHYGFSLLVDKAETGLRRFMLIAAGLTTLAVCLALAWLGLIWTIEARNTSSALQWPMAWFYAAIPVGAAIGSWHVFAYLIALATREG